jgi:hypothetical protein
LLLLVSEEGGREGVWSEEGRERSEAFKCRERDTSESLKSTGRSGATVRAYYTSPGCWVSMRRVREVEFSYGMELLAQRAGERDRDAGKHSSFTRKRVFLLYPATSPPYSTPAVAVSPHAAWRGRVHRGRSAAQEENKANNSCLVLVMLVLVQLSEAPTTGSTLCFNGDWTIWEARLVRPSGCAGCHDREGAAQWSDEDWK